MAGADRGRFPTLRVKRICQDPDGAARGKGLLLPELALPTYVLPDPGAAFDASLQIRVSGLGCGDIARLPRRRLSDCAAASGNRPGASVAIYGLEFSCRTKRVPDSLAAWGLAALSRETADCGGCIHRLSDLQAAIRHIASDSPCRFPAMARLR